MEVTEGKQAMAEDFIVDTIGRCFLCVKKIEAEEQEDPLSLPTTKTYSFHYASNYLKVDKSKAYGNGGQLSEKWLQKLAKQRLKVELCEGCEKLNDKFSTLTQQLEKIQMEMSSCLKNIHEKMLNAESFGLLECELSSLSALEKVNIAQRVRKEVIDKSAYKLKQTLLPRLELTKLPESRIIELTAKSKSVPAAVQSTSNGSNTSHRQGASKVLIRTGGNNDKSGSDNPVAGKDMAGLGSNSKSTATPANTSGFTLKNKRRMNKKRNSNSNSNTQPRKQTKRFINTKSKTSARISQLKRTNSRRRVVSPPPILKVLKDSTKDNSVESIGEEDEKPDLNIEGGLEKTEPQPESSGTKAEYRNKEHSSSKAHPSNKDGSARKPVLALKRGRKVSGEVLSSVRRVGNKFSCKICGKVDVYAHHLYQHVRVTHFKHRYFCDMCGKSYSWPTNLKQHKNVAHFGAVRKRFACNLCDKSYINQLYLKVHRQNAHFVQSAIGFKFRCPKCQKAFVGQSNLQKHIDAKSCRLRIKREIKQEEEEMD